MTKFDNEVKLNGVIASIKSFTPGLVMIKLMVKREEPAGNGVDRDFIPTVLDADKAKSLNVGDAIEVVGRLVTSNYTSLKSKTQTSWIVKGQQVVSNGPSDIAPSDFADLPHTFKRHGE